VRLNGKARDFGCVLYGTLGAVSLLLIPVVDQVGNPVVGRRLFVEMWIFDTSSRDPDGFAQVGEWTNA
jgi:hypothetical protein